MSILVFMVSDKMPSTSSFLPLIGRLSFLIDFSMSTLGWFYSCMILLITFGTLAASLVIYVQKQGKERHYWLLDPVGNLDPNWSPPGITVLYFFFQE